MIREAHRELVKLVKQERGQLYNPKFAFLFHCKNLWLESMIMVDQFS